jgi:hypothetical protein
VVTLVKGMGAVLVPKLPLSLATLPPLPPSPCGASGGPKRPVPPALIVLEDAEAAAATKGAAARRHSALAGGAAELGAPLVSHKWLIESVGSLYQLADMQKFLIKS